MTPTVRSDALDDSQMAASDAESPNPYQAPSVAEPSAMLPSLVTTPAAYKLLKDFRTQIHALGGAWIAIGSLAGVVALFVGATANPDQETALLLGILLAASTIWIALGVFSCYKQIWAVYIGLVLSYLSLIGNLLSINVCSLIIFVVVIVQAHRVLGWAKQLRRMGIPLTTLPQTLPAPQNRKVDFSQWQ
jgi:hypothetical protein